MTNADTNTEPDAESRTDAVDAMTVLHDVSRRVKYDPQTGEFVWLVPTRAADDPPAADEPAAVVYDAGDRAVLDTLTLNDALAEIEHYTSIDDSAVADPTGAVRDAIADLLGSELLHDLPDDLALGIMYATDVIEMTDVSPDRPTVEQAAVDARGDDA